MTHENQEQEMTFWDHLDELRKVIFRIVIAVSLLAVVAFINKTLLFDIIFAPHRSDFITYRALCALGTHLQMPSICPGEFHVDLINTQLASQLMAHMSVAFYTGLVVASPYIIYQLFGFIKPALYENERRYSTRTILAAFVLFFCGLLLNYYAIFPPLLPFFRYLPGQRICGEQDYPVFLHFHIHHALHCHGRRVRNSHPGILFRQNGIGENAPSEKIPPPCLCGDPDYFSHTDPCRPVQPLPVGHPHVYAL